LGAILTAVCTLEVVAPPINSGMRIPWRCISEATKAISSSEGVMSPERPTRSTPSSFARSRIVAAGTITPRVDDLEAVTLEHHADDVLADVVHVALDVASSTCGPRAAGSSGHPRRRGRASPARCRG
jgi:hypothetical protein